MASYICDHVLYCLQVFFVFIPSKTMVPLRFSCDIHNLFFFTSLCTPQGKKRTIHGGNPTLCLCLSLSAFLFLSPCCISVPWSLSYLFFSWRYKLGLYPYCVLTSLHQQHIRGVLRYMQLILIHSPAATTLHKCISYIISLTTNLLEVIPIAIAWHFFREEGIPPWGH